MVNILVLRELTVSAHDSCIVVMGTLRPDTAPVYPRTVTEIHLITSTRCILQNYWHSNSYIQY